MANPALLFLDTDVLFQLFICGALKPLHELRTRYGIMSAIVPEVHVELLSNKKFKGRFDAGLTKALSKGSLTIFDQAAHAQLSAQAGSLAAPPSVTYAYIQQVGNDYYRRVDRGEAFTHAAASALGQPAASNDFQAIKVLVANGHDVPIPVLRTFDLLAFAHDIGALSAADCDGFRQHLIKEGEYVPKEFRASKFIDGLSRFDERLAHTSSAAHVKRSTPLYKSKLCVKPQ